MIQPRKRNPVAPVVALSPIKASPNPSPYTGTVTAKENIMSFNRLAATMVDNEKKKNRVAGKEQRPNPTDVSPTVNARRPFGIATRDNLPRPVSMLSKKPSGNSHGAKAVRVLGDIRNTSLDERGKSRESTSAKDRVREWEREKVRLREMERLQEIEKERDEIHKKAKERKHAEKAKKRSWGMSMWAGWGSKHDSATVSTLTLNVKHDNVTNTYRSSAKKRQTRTPIPRPLPPP